MLKRIIAVSVVLVMCTPFAYAWNAESFIGFDQVQQSIVDVKEDPLYLLSSDTIYSLKSDASVMLMQPSSVLAVADDGSSDVSDDDTGAVSVSGFDFSDKLSLSPDTSYIGVQCVVYQPSFDVAGSTIPGYSSFTCYPLSLVSGNFHLPDSSDDRLFFEYAGHIPYDWGDAGGYYFTADCLRFGPAGSSWSGGNTVLYYDLVLDLSSFPSFTSFTLSGLIDELAAGIHSGGSAGWVVYKNGGTIEVLVNGNSVEVFNSSDVGSIDFSEFLYESSDLVESVVFRYTPASFSTRVPSSGLGTFFRGDIIFNRNFTFTTLPMERPLDGFNDQGQQAVDDLNSIEADWTGQMTSNFNNLNISNFTYPNGLVPAFALITGIFNDLWNIMGEFNIVYIFPLTLGVTLVVIGRLSKTSGGQSSSKSDRGNSDA